MSKIREVFKDKKAFIGFVVAGDPSVDKTVEFILEMADAGADIVEIGVPFSDPVAEGLVIQSANMRALSNGTKVSDVFEIAEKVRRKSAVKLVLLTYLNPVLHYGYDEFFTKCKAVGIDGIIIPDLPFEESGEVSDVSQKHGVDLISLVAPTSEERVEMIVGGAKGFLYLVSSMGTTGVRENIQTDVKSAVTAVKDAAKRLGNDIPVAVGFGISRAEQAAELCEYADGVIIGSAIVSIIEEYGDNAGAELNKYVREIKKAITER